MPPLDDLHRAFAVRLANDLPGLEVVAPKTLDDARRELPDADAAFGWIPPGLLPRANRLRWLQNPDAGPRAGYFYPALIEHPVVICNPRGIYNDHSSQHIMMFLLALARGLPYYFRAQRTPYASGPDASPHSADRCAACADHRSARRRTPAGHGQRARVGDGEPDYQIGKTEIGLGGLEFRAGSQEHAVGRRECPHRGGNSGRVVGRDRCGQGGIAPSKRLGGDGRVQVATSVPVGGLQQDKLVSDGLPAAPEGTDIGRQGGEVGSGIDTR